MPAFKKFGPGDQVDNVLILEPQYNLASGSNNGWKGSPEVSGALSLYGGARRSPSDTMPDIRYQVQHPSAGQFGQVVRGTPLTASVQYVYMTNETLGLTQRTATRWGDEHFAVTKRLYHLYHSVDPDYVTGSYDHYCVYFQRNSRQVVTFDPPAAAGINLTSSFTIESWVKPFNTSSATSDFTIASMNRVFWFGITGSTGQLQISSSFGTFTASIGPAANRWSHVSVAYDAGAQVGAFTINMADAGTFSQTTFSATLAGYLPAFTVGQQLSGTNPIGNEGVLSGNLGLANRSFHGFIGETRLWSVRRTVTQLSSSMSSPIAAFTVLTGSVVRTRLSDGPLMGYPTDPLAFSPAFGSGALDVAAYEQDVRSNTGTRKLWGTLNGFINRVGPTWHPSDNVHYTLTKQFTKPLLDPRLVPALGLSSLSGSYVAAVNRMLVVDVPSAFYGRQIVPNTVRLTCNSFNSSVFGLVRTLIDDGRGGLFLSGSACSSSLVNREEYRGVEWTKVGNVFYSEGLIVIKDPALLDFGTPTLPSTNNPDDLLQLSFRGQSRVPVKTLMCRVEGSDFNASLNPTFTYQDNHGRYLKRHPSGSIRVTTVGIYNADRELVAVARYADPPRIRSRDRMNLKLRMDF